MSGKRNRLIVAALTLMLFSTSASAQNADTTYALIVYGGGGFTRNLSQFDVLPSGLQRNGFGGTLRIMMRPEHLLRVGLETGLTQVYYVKSEGVQTDFGITDFTSSMNAVPILLVFSMPLVEHLDIYAGSGGFLMYSNTESFGTQVTASAMSIGFMLGLSYMVPLEGDWGIGGELKWYHMDKFSDDNIMLHLMVSYRFLEW
jgi:hypothetical protein